jgi:cytochrome P450
MPEFFVEISRLLIEQYGNVCYMWVGPELRIRLGDAGLVQEVLKSQSYNFGKASTMKLVLGPILGANSMLLTEGDVHRRHRRIASSAFHFDAMKALVPLISACAARAVDAWTTAARASESAPADSMERWRELELNSLCSVVTLSIIGRAAFAANEDVGSGGLVERTSSLLEASVTAVFSLSGLILGLIPGFRKLPLPAHVRMDRQVRA